MHSMINLLIGSVNVQDPNWYKARSASGQQGMIPAPYVQERPHDKLSAMP